MRYLGTPDSIGVIDHMVDAMLLSDLRIDADIIRNPRSKATGRWYNAQDFIATNQLDCFLDLLVIRSEDVGFGGQLNNDGSQIRGYYGL